MSGNVQHEKKNNLRVVWCERAMHGECHTYSLDSLVLSPFQIHIFTGPINYQLSCFCYLFLLYATHHQQVSTGSMRFMNLVPQPTA